MATHQIEIALAVSDYVEDDYDPKDAFAECEDDLEGAIEAAEDELKAYLEEADARQLCAHSAAFVEFDSPNWTHAGAYFHVTIEGPEELIKKFLVERDGAT